MKLFDELYKNQHPTHFAESDEMAFYLANRNLLMPFDSYERFTHTNDPFQVVRANILIRSIMNKKSIERLYYEKLKSPKKEEVKVEKMSLEDYMSQGLSELPYLEYEGKKIYVPLFPASLNVLYSERFEKLALEPYEAILQQYESLMIDPFDYYGNLLYDSYFTKLVAIKRSGSILAAFDFDASAIYFINDQGRLDTRLALFDQNLNNPVSTHLTKRLLDVVNAYFSLDREALLHSLSVNHFISEKLLTEIEEKRVKEEIRNAPKDEKKDKDII
jgi:hypothetical protein